MQPFGYAMVGLDGKLDPAGRQIAGQVTLVPICTDFTLTRVVQPPRRVAAACRPAASVTASAAR
jgi:hypothetical protein